MKIYELSYRWTGGERHIPANSPEELIELLDRAIEDPKTIRHSIDIKTIERDMIDKKSLKTPANPFESANQVINLNDN